MMFGAILSATDPVAVVALLRDVGASKQLAMVIEGEALLNDGAAIVFFNVFLRLVTSEHGTTGKLVSNLCNNKEGQILFEKYLLAILDLPPFCKWCSMDRGITVSC